VNYYPQINNRSKFVHLLDCSTFFCISSAAETETDIQRERESVLHDENQIHTPPVNDGGFLSFPYPPHEISKFKLDSR
jgi:hypothetical protein